MCGWYPSSVLPQNGDFIKRHAEAVSSKHRVSVLHIISKTGVSKTQIEVIKKGDLATYIVSNGEFTCDPVNIDIFVADLPGRPTASDSSADGIVNNPVSFSFSASDPNGLPLTYFIVDNSSSVSFDD